MKLDIDKTIGQMEERCTMLGNPTYMEDAVQVLRMWKDLKQSASQWDVGMAPQLRLHCIIEKIEEEFFPSVVTQTVTIEVQGKNEESLRDTIQQVRLLYGVKDVRPHDSRY